ncbi:MAG: Zn-ribbon domain-containing OB-fold protein [Desulfobacterales bacterium]
MACKGKGKVYTFAVYHTAFHSGFEDELPYVVAIVELEEGPRMMANITGCDPGGVYCGMEVEVTWTDATEEFSIPGFSPLTSKLNQ